MPDRPGMRDEPRRRWRPPRYALIAFAVALGVVVGLVAALLRSPHAPAAGPGPLNGQVTWPAGMKRAPPFTLRDERGRTVSLRSLQGHPVLVTFLDSHSKRDGSVEGRLLREVLGGLRETRATLLVVSVDPWADTPAGARAFAAHARWRGNWHWLFGDRAALAPVWRAFNIVVKRVPGDVLHSAALYVVDSRGDLRAAYLFPFSAGTVASDVRGLEG
jgi:cytochrome oxidase Cu insertion factor (SCO1/SenC/PrrC family)